MKISIIQLSILVFIIGFLLGGFFTYSLISFQLTNMISNLRIEKVEVGFNETYIMDRMDKIVSENKPIENCNGTLIDSKGVHCKS